MTATTAATLVVIDTIKYTSATDDIMLTTKGIAGSEMDGDKAGIGSDTLKAIESVIGLLQ